MFIDKITLIYNIGKVEEKIDRYRFHSYGKGACMKWYLKIPNICNLRISRIKVKACWYTYLFIYFNVNQILSYLGKITSKEDRQLKKAGYYWLSYLNKYGYNIYPENLTKEKLQKVLNVVIENVNSSLKNKLNVDMLFVGDIEVNKDIAINLEGRKISEIFQCLKKNKNYNVKQKYQDTQYLNNTQWKITIYNKKKQLLSKVREEYLKCKNLLKLDRNGLERNLFKLHRFGMLSDMFYNLIFNFTKRFNCGGFYVDEGDIINYCTKRVKKEELELLRNNYKQIISNIEETFKKLGGGGIDIVRTEIEIKKEKLRKNGIKKINDLINNLEDIEYIFTKTFDKEVFCYNYIDYSNNRNLYNKVIGEDKFFFVFKNKSTRLYELLRKLFREKVKKVDDDVVVDSRYFDINIEIFCIHLFIFFIKLSIRPPPYL